MLRWGNLSFAFLLEDITVAPRVSASDLTSRLCLSHKHLVVKPKTGLEEVTAKGLTSLCCVSSAPKTSLVSVLNTATEV
jgi:hypothetical protein